MTYQHDLANVEVATSAFWTNRVAWNPFMVGFSSKLIPNPDAAACQNPHDGTAAELMELANNLCFEKMNNGANWGNGAARIGWHNIGRNSIQ